jgi:hypothetical protein
MKTTIIDRDIAFYLSSTKTEKQIMLSCLGDDPCAVACLGAANGVVQALRRYRAALDAAGRIEEEEKS